MVAPAFGTWANCATGLEDWLADAQIRHAGTQACLQVFQSADWESTRNAMCMIVVYLKKYAEHIGVFAELQKQVR